MPLPSPADERIVLSFDEWALAKMTASRRMKASNGHYFITVMKTRCQFCGRSPRAKGKCGAWFETFMAQLDIVLFNLERERDGWAERAEATHAS